jgi:hypothetical protein
MSSTERLVRQKVETDRVAAEAVSSQLKLEQRRGDTITPASVRRYFPEVNSLGYSISNLPLGAKASHYVLLGMPFVFDLEPLSALDFERKSGLSISFVEELTELGLVYPNLWVRDPGKWAGFEHMEGLLRRSTVNGERVDSFMSVLGNFQDRLEDRRTELHARLERSDREDDAAIVRALGRDALKNLPIQQAYWWAYLDVFDPVLTSRIEETLAKGQMVNFVRGLRYAKMIVASPTTAAIGGTYVSGPEHMHYFRALSQKNASEEAEKLSRAIAAPEALEYLIRRIAGYDTFNLPLNMREPLLRRFVSAEENIALRNQVAERICDLVDWANQGSIKEASITDYRKLVDDYRRRVNLATKGASATVAGAVGSAGTAVGYGIEVAFSGAPTPVVGPILASFGANAICALLPVSEAWLGSAMATLKGNSRQHRTFLFFERVAQQP